MNITKDVKRIFVRKKIFQKIEQGLKEIKELILSVIYGGNICIKYKKKENNSV